MKYSIIFTTVITLALTSQLVTAGSIADTYGTGDPLTAAKMNEIRDAVNDNDATKQTRVLGNCAVGQSIRLINADGTVSCEVDTDTDTNTTYSAGTGLSLSGTTFSVPTKTHYFTVPAVAFRPYESDTTFTGSDTNPFMNITGGTIGTIAAVNLPHGARITGLSMRAWDVSVTNFVKIDLRKFAGGATTSLISSVTTTAAENVGSYVKSDNTISEVVDLSTSNHNFYYLVQTLQAAGSNSGPGVYAVRITYTY